MPLIEYNEIGNVLGEESSWVKDVSLALCGVIVGFVLSEVATRIRYVRLRNSQGESFNEQLESIKVKLKSQIESLALYIEYFKKDVSYNPAINFYPTSLDFIKGLDKHLVSAYVKRKKGKAALKNYEMQFGAVGLVEIESARFMKEVEEGTVFMSEVGNEFRDELTKITRTFFEVYEPFYVAKKEEPYLDRLAEIFNDVLLVDHPERNFLEDCDKMFNDVSKLNMSNRAHSFSRECDELLKKPMDLLKKIRMQKMAQARRYEVMLDSMKLCQKALQSNES